MGADNFLNNDFDSDAARYDRQNRMNPPEFAPGQGSGGDDLFSSGFESPVSTGGFDVFSSSPPSNTGMAGSFEGMDMGMGMGMGMTQPSQQQSNAPKSDEDRFYEIASSVGKVGMGFFKDLIASFKGLTPKFTSVYGKNTIIVSIIVTVVGMLLWLFHFAIGIQLIVGGMLSGAVGVMLLMFYVEKGALCSSQYADDNSYSEPQPQPQPQPMENPLISQSDFADDFGGDDFINDMEGGGFDEYDDGFGDDYNDDFDDDDFDFSEPPQEVSSEGTNIEDALNNLTPIDRGMYTRQYLYDMFVEVLPNLRSNFSDVKSYDEDSDVFLSWDNTLREAALVSGCKEEELPDLLELNETLLTIKVICTRPKSLKPELLAKEIANLYAYKDGEFNDRVYAVADTVGSRCIITLYTGETALVSLKDMYAHIKSDILNSSNYMPIVLGIDQSGKVIWCDFKKIESCIVAGMPRSGKSWLVQAMLTQMCAFVSPRELNIYIFDPKAGTSDFRSFTLPHVKKFATRYKNEQGTVVNEDGTDILATLSEIVRVEAPRRKRILGDAECVNIWDFRRKCPDVDLPLLYIVIDEAVTLAEDMEKEDKKEYQSYITQLITQFPNLGIRAFLIPHVVKDQIIKKTATDSVKCRISVKGSPDHIESSTGTKPRAFKYKLCNVGDMAVNIPDIKQQTMFVHGVALTDDNEKNSALFDYLRRVWARLEPDTVNGSVSERAEDDRFSERLIESSDSIDDITEEDLFGDTEEQGGIPDLFSEENSNGLSSMNVDESDDDFLSDFM